MPRKTDRTRRFLFRLFFLSVAGCVLAVRGRDGQDATDDAAQERQMNAPARETIRPVTGPVKLEAWEVGRRSPVARRVALATAFTSLFFAGAALTAGAGDQAAKLLEDTTPDTTTTAVASEPEQPEAVEPAAAPMAPAVAEEAAPAPAPKQAEPAAEPVQPESAPDPAESAPTADATEESQVEPQTAATAPKPSASPAKARPAHPRAKSKPAARKASAREEADAEAAGGAAVIWLNRALPDPTPPAKRLTRPFARRLVTTSRAANADWALVLGVLRAQGHDGRVPATRVQVRRLARALAARGARRDAWGAVLALTGQTALADQAVALARYNRAVGMESLVNGLAHQKARLVEKLLDDRRVSVYGGGRDDLAGDRIDVRVVALVAYMAETFGQVSVSSLFSGHRLYARPGVVSAHVYGHAVDITSVGGMPIAGNQQPGGVTEQAVRQILLLPAELQPRQVISLLGLGGASFPLGDHGDHIHVGY